MNNSAFALYSLYATIGALIWWGLIYHPHYATSLRRRPLALSVTLLAMALFWLPICAFLVIGYVVMHRNKT